MRKVQADLRRRGGGLFRVLTVGALSRSARAGTLRCGAAALRCALGRGGRLVAKREGDGATPIGRFAICEVLYRSDRVRRPRTGLPSRPLRRGDGWCEEPRDRNYNRLVRHPYAGAEVMWRDDHLYDVVVVLGYNVRPRVRGRGSAIFMHLARPGYTPTAGCVALSARDMRLVLERLAPGTIVHVRA